MRNDDVCPLLTCSFIQFSLVSLLLGGSGGGEGEGKEEGGGRGL